MFQLFNNHLKTKNTDGSATCIAVKQKLIIVNNRQTQNIRWDRQSLNQKEKMNKYREEVQQELQEIDE